MIYIILNVVAIAILCLLTYQFDRNNKFSNSEVGSLVISTLLLTIESVILTITLIFSDIWSVTMTHLMLKFMFMIEGAFFVCLFCSLIAIGLTRRSKMLTFIQFLAYVGIIVFVLTKFEQIDISPQKGIIIGSEYLFKDPVRKFFPWTWVTLYNVLCRVLMPGLGCLCMLLLRERKATPLMKYQGVLFIRAFAFMWAVSFFIKYYSAVNPSFSLLYLYAYVLYFSLVYYALMEKTVPSGRGYIVGTVKALFCYILPGVAIAFAYAYTQPTNGNFTVIFILVVFATAVAGVLFSWKAYDFIMYGARITTNDYEHNFEVDLGTVNYNLEMDQVTKHMFEVFYKNVSCSTMNVYVDDGHGKLITAYSSNGTNFEFPVSTQMFDILLNENRNIVIYQEIDDTHEYDLIRADLKKFFADAQCDALVILNEGHNIVGLITLGKKISGDHYKEYDKNVFTKLYSYFFVFGYYMRNISNKEVLDTVNREIKMASQIITSIQENVDHIKSNKIDAGYLMVPAHSIGGEFIDLIRLTDTRHLIVVGDLSGKGIAASMNMVILKSIIRTFLTETHDFKQLVVKTNNFIRDSLQKGTIFAGLFALIDYETDTMYYINCGIPALFMYTQVYNNVIEIQGSGYILGFVKDISPYLSVKTTKLNRGDIVLCCTDGLINSHSLRGEKFGRERVQQALLDNLTYPAQRMAQFTFEGLLKFMSKEMEDDVSILYLKYKTAAEFATPEELAAERAAAEKLKAQEEIAAEPSEESEGETSETGDNSATEAIEAQGSGENSGAMPEEPATDAGGLPPGFDPAMADAFAAAAAMGGEMPDFSDAMAEMDASTSTEAAEETSDATGEVASSDSSAEIPEENMFINDISSEGGKDSAGGDFDFDPSAFGLPEGFEL